MEALRPGRIGAVGSPAALQWLGGIALALLLALVSPRLELWDAWLADRLGQLNQQSPPVELALVDIDEASLEQLGAWPWPRERLALLADHLAAAGARQQIWDIALPESRPADHRLSASLEKHGVVLGMVPVIDPAVIDPPVAGSTRQGADAGGLCREGTPFASARGRLGLAETLKSVAPLLGHLAPIFDPDGRLRRIPAIVCDSGVPVPSLALAASISPDEVLRLQVGVLPGQAPWRLVGRSLDIPLDANGNIPLQFSVPVEAYSVVPAHLLLAGEVPLGALEGKTVILGSTALGIGDRVATVHSPSTPGVVIHAELYSRLQAGRFVVMPKAVALISLVLSLLVALPLYFAAARPLAWIFALSIVTIAGGLVVKGWLVSVALPLLAVPIAVTFFFARRALMERAARRVAEARLATLLPPALRQQLANESASDVINAQELRAGLVHARLRNFEPFASRTPPEIALATLHGLERLAHEIAARHGAELYPGDAADLLLVWPDAKPETDAPRMLAAARELHAASARLIGPIPATPAMALALAVSIDSVRQGFIGTRARRRPILFGSLVDITRQMLTLSEDLAAPLLVSAPVAQAIDPAELRLIGDFKLLPARFATRLFACPRTFDALERPTLVA